MNPGWPEPAATVLLRRSLLVLAGASLAGTAIELAMLRHWGSPLRLVPWFALGGLAGALALVVARPSGRTVRLARIVAAAAVVTGVFGVVEHVVANYEAAPLDFRYGPRWAAMSAAARWWAAATKTVGPAPPLTPAVLAWAALCLWFATLRHPALGSGGRANPHPAHRELPGVGAMLGSTPLRGPGEEDVNDGRT